MAFSVVQRSVGSFNANVTLNGVAAGNTLIALIEFYTGGTVTGVTGDSFSQVANALAQIGDKNVDIWLCPSSAGGDITVAPSFSSASFWALHVYEVTPGGVLDVAANATGTSATSSSCSLTTATANEFLASIIVQGNGAVTVPSGWDTSISESLIYRNDSSDLADSGAAGSKSANWSWSSSATYAESFLALKTGAVTITSKKLPALGVG